MDYTEACDIVKSNYTQYDVLISQLCTQSIITLGQLYKQNIKRNMSPYTIDRLAKMAPHEQAGYIANPLLQFCLSVEPPKYESVDSLISKPKTKKVVEKKEDSKQNTKVSTTVEPVELIEHIETIEDPDDDINLFRLF
jgi:hypothetical protein